MDWGLFWQAAGVGVAVVGVIAGGFYWLWAQIGQVRDDGEKGISQVRTEAALRAEALLALTTTTKEELHQHKLHVAETYFPRANMREVMDPVMEAISGVRDQITGMSGRIDRLMERPSTSRTSTRS